MYIYYLGIYLNKTSGKIYNKDYKLILDKAKSLDFVFLDPPYIEIKNGVYQYKYNKDVDLGEIFVKDLLKEIIKV